MTLGQFYESSWPGIAFQNSPICEQGNQGYITPKDRYWMWDALGKGWDHGQSDPLQVKAIPAES